MTELKKSLRNHRHRKPEGEFAVQYNEITSSKKPAKIKEAEMNELLLKFKIQKHGLEQTTHSAKEYEDRSDTGFKRKIDYRKLCLENQMDPLETNVEAIAKNNATINKLVLLNYYTRKLLKGKELKAVVDATMPESATYVYYVTDTEETTTKGTASSSGYDITTDLANKTDEQVATSKPNTKIPLQHNTARAHTNRYVRMCERLSEQAILDTQAIDVHVWGGLAIFV